MTERVLLDPTAELTAAGRNPVAPLASLDDVTVGLLDITKRKGDIFLDQLEKRFTGDLAKALQPFKVETSQWHPRWKAN